MDEELQSRVVARRGRPRNPAVEQRIFDAALDLYGRLGWLGFNFDAIARGSKVSKATIYLRWQSREQLITDALSHRWNWVADIDSGRLRDDLLTLAVRTFETFAGPYGAVALQLRMEAPRFAAVRIFAEPYRDMMVHQGRAIVRRAIDRGELSASVNPGLIMDLVIGAIVNHVISTPDWLREQMLAEKDRFVVTLVDVVLKGARSIA